MVAELIDWLYAQWMIGGFVVAFLFAPVVIDHWRRREFDERFSFALAITVGWTGSALTRSFWYVWRLVGKPPEWADSPFILIAGAFVIFGAFLHMRTALVVRRGLWLPLIAGIMAVAALVS